MAVPRSGGGVVVVGMVVLVVLVGIGHKSSNTESGRGFGDSPPSVENEMRRSAVAAVVLIHEATKVPLESVTPLMEVSPLEKANPAGAEVVVMVTGQPSTYSADGAVVP